MMRLTRLLLPAAILYGVVAGLSGSNPPIALASNGQSSPPTFPGDTWQRVADPTRAGWSRSGLDSVQSMVSRMNSSAMVVLEQRKIVYSYGDLTAQSYLASVRKSILSMLYGIEIARGHIDTAKTLATLGINDVG